MEQRAIQVLLVDDSPGDRLIVQRLLGRATARRIDVVVAKTYTAGLHELTRRTFDVCLVDYRLGHHSGVALIRDALAAAVTTPMVVLTGLDDAQREAEARAAGAVDYLDKCKLTCDQLSALFERLGVAS